MGRNPVVGYIAAMHDTHLRPGWPALVPYLVVDEAAALAEWLAKALGAEIDELEHHEDGSLMHGTLRFGASVFELSDARPERPAQPSMLHLYLPDVDRAYSQAVALGATSLLEPTQLPYGERSCGLVDPAGNQWWLATYTG